VIKPQHSRRASWMAKTRFGRVFAMAFVIGSFTCIVGTPAGWAWSMQNRDDAHVRGMLTRSPGGTLMQHSTQNNP
jgi:hypothetical protein